jgi:hypothetical protein
MPKTTKKRGASRPRPPARLKKLAPSRTRTRKPTLSEGLQALEGHLNERTWSLQSRVGILEAENVALKQRVWDLEDKRARMVARLTDKLRDELGERPSAPVPAVDRVRGRNDPLPDDVVITERNDITAVEDNLRYVGSLAGLGNAVYRAKE